jgi:hypothetical protein
MPNNGYNRGTRGQAVGRANANFRRQIRQMQRENGTVLKIGSAAGDPPAITNNGKFVDRIVDIPASDGNDTISIGLICQALENKVSVGDIDSTGCRGDFFVLKIQIWATGAVDGKLTASFKPNNLLTNAGRLQDGADLVAATDFGTGSRRAGIKCHVPAANARLLSFNTGSPDLVATKIFSGTGSSSKAGWGTCHITVRQKF